MQQILRSKSDRILSHVLAEGQLGTQLTAAGGKLLKIGDGVSKFEGLKCVGNIVIREVTDNIPHGDNSMQLQYSSGTKLLLDYYDENTVEPRVTVCIKDTSHIWIRGASNVITILPEQSYILNALRNNLIFWGTSGIDYTPCTANILTDTTFELWKVDSSSRATCSEAFADVQTCCPYIVQEPLPETA